MKCKTKCCRGQTIGHNTLCSKCMMRLWRTKYPIKAVFSNLRNRARRRGKEFLLTLEQFTNWLTQHNLLDAKRGHDGNCISVDRIDQSKGYSLDNIQPLTISENARKWHHTDKHQTELGADCPF